MMKINIAKFLIIANITIFLISIGVVYYRISKTTVEEVSTAEKENDFTDTNINTDSVQKKDTEETLDTTKTELQQTEKKLRHIRFSYFSAKAQNVSIIGDFNNWMPQPLKKVDKSKSKWEIVLEMPNGKYLYNFLVDGKIVTDINNKKPTEESSQGFQSSVLELK